MYGNPIIIRGCQLTTLTLCEERSSVKFASNDTAATGDIGTGGRGGSTAHSVAIFVKPPLGVRARDEATLGVPASNPVDAVVEEEEAQLFRTRALVQWGVEPAAALL